MRYNFKRYCKNYQDIENYEKAKVDDFIGWECHHRLETHNSDGERRLVDISHKELKALDMYYNRPASELIFLRKGEHAALHQKGKQKSEEFRRKMREVQKGRQVSDETRKKLREALTGENHPMYGRHHSEETRRKMREARKGKNWFNNSKIEIMAKECPPGFVPGRLR